jgi:glycogen operon protein
VSWYDWQGIDEPLLDYTRRLIALRRAHPVFRRRRWFGDGLTVPLDEVSLRDIDWHHPHGVRMRDDEWHTERAAAIAVYLSGQHLVDGDGQPITDDAFYLCLNARDGDLEFVLPGEQLGARWERVLDTAAVEPFGPWRRPHAPAGSALLLAAHTLLLLRAVPAVASFARSGSERQEVDLTVLGEDDTGRPQSRRDQ